VRSLAVKIFLGFWTIHAVIFVVFVFYPDPGRTVYLLDRLHRDGLLASSLYEARGAESCSDYLAQVERVESVELVLYTDTLQRLCTSSTTLDDRLFQGLLAKADTFGQFATIEGADAGAIRVAGPSGRHYRALRRFKAVPSSDHWAPRGSLTFLGVALFVSGVVCFVLARYLAAPLRRLSEATNRLKMGDLGARAGIGNRNDEIGDVVRDFDVMADRIESLVQGQRQLLSDISHELRSPLARLSVAVELARRTAGPGADSHLTRIETEAGRMNDLIGRLLSLSRDEQAESATGPVPFDLADAVRRVADDARYEAERAGRRVVLTGDMSAIAKGDPVLVASALDNVVRNAIRYTAAESAVEIRIGRDGQSARVVVRDHGPGVPDAELERIFLPFYRLDASRNRESGGIGLGLSIARRAITRMGGTIAAENAMGGGLQVTITLPA
jgi:two-component system, OmpR family, sensor histidine kinase CpxA